MPITKQATKHEWNKILVMAQNNGFPQQLIHRLRNKLIAKKDRTTATQTRQHDKRKWVTFTYHSPSVHKITSLVKRTNLKIAFRPTNMIYQQLSRKSKDSNPRGIYQLKCNTCNNGYVGQSSRPITVRHREHLRYIRNNNPISAYATHILDKRHGFGSADETLKLLKSCTKGTRMGCWEALCMHIHYKHNILISKQQVTDTNPLFDLARIPRDLQRSS